MFTKDFIFGAATAAAQIEGGAAADGKGASVWDDGAAHRSKNYIFRGHSPSVACDHYGRWREDVAIMKEMGLKAYRFSISWPRLFPEGTGKLNKEGAAFYDKLIDELLKNGIEPYVTLYHWDYPLALLHKGGWLNPDSPGWFEAYAKIVAGLYSDRVKNFIILNEPECFVNLGYGNGAHAPFYRLPAEEVFRIAHNVLKSNALAVGALRGTAKKPLRLGNAHAMAAFIPVGKDDEAAAEKAFFDNRGTEFWNSFFSDAIAFGAYSDDKMKNFGTLSFPETDMRMIKQNMDFIGINCYRGEYVKAADNERGYETVPDMPFIGFTGMEDWTIAPDCLYWCAKHLSKRYAKPLIVTENGVSLAEIPGADGGVGDDARIEYIKTHLTGIERAINEGIEVGGYFYWSLVDNFEWAHGYSQRFGLVRVDFETGKRTLKKSAYWYRDLIKTV